MLQFLGKTEDQQPSEEFEKSFYEKTKQSFSESDTTRELSRFEKMTSEHMIQSKNESVHAQMFIEADITNLSDWRENQKEKILQREKFKVVVLDNLVYGHKEIVEKILKVPNLEMTGLNKHNVHDFVFEVAGQGHA